MTNNIIALDFNGVKIILDSTTKLVRITIPTGTASTTTFHDSADNTNYQVPTGKKATIIFIDTWDVTLASGMDISFADNADGNTNAVTIFDPATAALISNLIFISAEVPADKFINFIRVSGSSDAELRINVLEENA